MKRCFRKGSFAKIGLVVLVFLQVILFTGCQKTYTFEELRPYYEEIHTDWVNKEYRGVVDVGIEAIKAGGKVGFIITVDMNEKNSYAKETTQKLREKYGDILLVFANSDKINTTDRNKLKPYLEEIGDDWEDGVYPGLLTFGTGLINRGKTSIDMVIDISNEKAEETAKSLKQKYGDKVIVKICERYISLTNW